MKKFLAIVIFLFFVSLSQISAQPVHKRGSIVPGVQQIIVQYGDQLELTDKQKSELITLSLKQRSEMSKHHMWGKQRRPGMHRHKKRGIDRTERRQDQKQGQKRVGPGSRMQDIYKVLNDEQTETLKSLLTERAEKAHEYRTLRNEIFVNQAEIEGKKAEQVTEILNRQSERRRDISLKRIQNPGETEPEAMREAFKNMRSEYQEIKTILTAAEYEKLQQEMLPRLHRRHAALRRFIHTR